MQGVDQSFGGVDQAAQALVDRAVGLKTSFGVAESLTGGLIGAHVTAVPGSSAAFAGGIIAYSETIKTRLLGVPAQLMKDHSVVSLPVAEEMARGAQQALNVRHAVAVTGVAGPGPHGRHPAGTVAIAWLTDGELESSMFSFDGDRDAVRTQTVMAALSGLTDRLARRS